jgi:hypothetical protein
MNHDQQNDDYLWDRSGAPDPEIVRLEQMLGTLRHKGGSPDFAPSLEESREPKTGRAGRWTRIMYSAGAIAAALVLLAIGAAAWVTFVQPRIGWAVEAVAGTPSVDGRAIDGSARLGVGRWLTTDNASRARISVGQIGHVDVEPNTRVQLVESRGREHRMSLVEGTIHARIWAPPKFFFVNTPAAVAIDLGCAYTLQVQPDGSGLVRVTHGWVGFEHAGRESFIPEQAVCATRPGIGPGTPQYEDAPASFPDSLAILDFASPDDARRPAAYEAVLSQARRRDALTLWHLLQRGTADERAKVYERMAALAPPPSGVTRDAVLSGDRRAIDVWWNSLGLDTTTWWRMWKKNW